MKIQLFTIPFKNIVFLVCSLLFAKVSNGQTYCLTYAVAKGTNTIDVTLGLKASGSTFKLGAGNLQFRYKKACVSTPTLVSNSLTATGRYNGISVTQPTPPSFAGTGDGLVSFNFNFTGILGTGFDIPTTGTNIAVIRFQIVDGSLSPNLRPYDNGSSGTVVYNDDPNDPLLLETTGNCETYNFPIPVEWLSMNVYATPNSKQKTVTIDWATASEVNNSHFIIERSSDKLLFEPIGQIKAANKASTYRFVDSNPMGNLLYYRIRQVDLDGTETVSKVEAVMLQKPAKLKVYPTITNNFLIVETEEESDFTIVNLLGQQLLNGPIKQHIDVSALPQGIYIFNAGKEQVKFIKQ